MHGMMRMLALALMMAMAAVPNAPAMPFLAQAAHPAGCHSHGPASPIPSPVDYQCCASGHQAAMPNIAFSLRSASAQLCLLHGGEDLELESVPRQFPTGEIVSSYSPPGTSPLRI